MPRTTPAGFVIGVFPGFTGFGRVWHIWWLTALTLFGAIPTLIIRSCDDDISYDVPAEDVARIEERHRLRSAAPVPLGS